MDASDNNGNNNNASSKIQHVTKKSSDELLRKFAQVDSEKEDKAAAKKELQLAKRLKRSTSRINKAAAFGHGRVNVDQSSSLIGTGTNNASINVEMKSLLPPRTSRRSGKLARRLGIGKATKVRARDIKNRSIMGTVAKTWRRTIESTYKVFMEKHYNRHKRLSNDLY